MSTDRYDALLAELQKLVPDDHWDLVSDLDEEVHWQLLVAEHAGAAHTREGRLGTLLLKAEHRIARLGA